MNRGAAAPAAAGPAAPDENTKGPEVGRTRNLQGGFWVAWALVGWRVRVVQEVEGGSWKGSRSVVAVGEFCKLHLEFSLSSKGRVEGSNSWF